MKPFLRHGTPDPHPCGRVLVKMLRSGGWRFLARTASRNFRPHRSPLPPPNFFSQLTGFRVTRRRE